MVEAMKIMTTSFKRSHALPHSVPPASGNCKPRPPPETPRHSWASLGQSLVGSLLLYPPQVQTRGQVGSEESFAWLMGSGGACSPQVPPKVWPPVPASLWRPGHTDLPPGAWAVLLWAELLNWILHLLFLTNRLQKRLKRDSSSSALSRFLLRVDGPFARKAPKPRGQPLLRHHSEP